MRIGPALYLRLAAIVVVGLLALVAAVGLRGHRGWVGDGRIVAADREPQNWLTNGRTYGEQRYSPLDQITAANLSRVGLAWEASLQSDRFGIETTPIVVDGVMYVTSTWSRVFAFDARTGRQLWMFDPKVPRDWLRNGCCKAVNRGVAVWKGKVYVGAFDGRLIALDAVTGRPVWSVDTTDHTRNYTITGAPRVVKGRVLIGNGGADFAVRGYFSAYDAETGALDWRFYVTPGDPRKPYENPALKLAARTWDPKRDWSIGGGGAPWDSFSYDPDLDLLYVGTGNGGPDDERLRSPAGGDNLFVSSILAVKPETGRLVWHYQTTPGDQWDYEATEHLLLADIPFGGRVRKVLMQAPKNGFFYVLDRATGRLLAADKYVRANWADSIDLKTGRPAMTGAADYSQSAKLVFPSPYGGHNWMPMAYSPRTGLVYVPARDIGWIWDSKAATWFYQGEDLAALTRDDVMKETRGVLIAWNPAARKPAWSAPQPALTNGGLLATAGDFIVQGTQDGYIEFRDAAHGRLLRRLFIGTGIVAPPISYGVDGVQYIAVAAGWNGVNPQPAPPDARPPYDNAGRLIVLKLGGGPIRVADREPPPQPFLAGVERPPADLVFKGRALYQSRCAYCHGLFGEHTPFPDLRRISRETYERFDDIVLGGAYKAAGMASFADVLTPSDTPAIRAYLADWAARASGEAGAKFEARRPPARVAPTAFP